jgi:hypothetical protein
MQIKLGESWLLLEQHHSPFALLEHFQLFFPPLHFSLLL